MTDLEQDIALIRASGCFDEEFYLREYPDVATLGIDPAEHYVRLGARLLRNPSGEFNTAAYLKRYPGIESMPINPLVHYVVNAGTHKVADSGPVASARARLEAVLTEAGRERVKGFVDRLDATGVTGWAVDRARPGKPVDLSVYVDGVHLMDVRTSEMRNDVSAAGMRGEHAGFTLTWPAGLLSDGVIVDVRYKTFNLPLSRSPKRFDGPAAATDRHIGYLDAFREERVLRTCIIVPIYNAFEAVQDCLLALEQRLGIDTEVLLVNDCSTDPRIASLLAEYVDKERFRVYHNPENLGYTRSVNKAIGMCQNMDVVLLNSDTVVTDRWIENLRYCAYSGPKVATVTAFSDNAGAFSSPEIGQFNPLPEGMTAEQFALTVTQSGEGRLLEVPTGNGFCLYIRRVVIESIGAFDEARFPRGYGEENDFCMRAFRNGWKNLVCDKAYVFHKRSQSFQGEKAQLMEAGAKAVDAAFPEYRLLTGRFRDAEFSLVRSRARGALHRNGEKAALPRAMYVISTQTGGTPQTNMDLMRSMQGKYECLLLRCDSKVITLSILKRGQLRELETHVLSRVIDPITHRSDEYDRVVLDMLYRHSISLLHIRHIGWHSMGLAQAAKSINLPVIYSSHDFYALCPSLNLLDENLQYCGGKCTAGNGTCQIALWPTASLPSLKHRFISRWREMFGAFLDQCDEIITTAPSAAEIILSVYPENRNKLRVIPHGREFSTFSNVAVLPAMSEKIRILVPGNISLSKGAQLIKEMAALDKEGKVEFHFLGDVWAGLSGVGVHHGKYSRESFAEKVAAIAPHAGVVLSIWPETYCHTLTEMWACGVPVFGFDVGAVGDRLRVSGAGWLLALGSSAGEVLDSIISAVQDNDGFTQRIDATLAWQRTEGVWNDTGTMAIQYRDSYTRLLKGASSREKRLGMLIKGTGSHPATAHIRVLRPVAAASREMPIDARPVSAPWLLAGGVERIDAVIIQRDAVAPALTDPLIEALSAANRPFIYEIDDWLWNLPDDHRDHQITEETKVAMLNLAKAATLVTTSTPALASILSELGCRVKVVLNGSDEALWLSPLSDRFISEIGEQNGLLDSKQRVLYMGTRSHASDLALIAPAIEMLVAERPDVEVIQIGGGRLLPGARELKVPAAFSQYSDFVQWFRAVCMYATVAIAPLRDDEFNSAKSDIKALDYGFCLVPAIFSNVGPYREHIVHGETGLLCNNDVAVWHHSLVALLDSPIERSKIAAQAYSAAKRRGLNASIAEDWKTALASVLPI